MPNAYFPTHDECWDLWESEISYQNGYELFEMGLNSNEAKAYQDKVLGWDEAEKQIYSSSRYNTELIFNKEKALDDMIASEKAIKEEEVLQAKRLLSYLEISEPLFYKPIDELLQTVTIDELMKPYQETIIQYWRECPDTIDEYTPYWKKCVDNIEKHLQL